MQRGTQRPAKMPQRETRVLLFEKDAMSRQQVSTLRRTMANLDTPAASTLQENCDIRQRSHKLVDRLPTCAFGTCKNGRKDATFTPSPKSS